MHLLTALALLLALLPPQPVAARPVGGFVPGALVPDATVRAQVAAPPDAPPSVNAFATENYGELIVEWRQPKDHGSPITSYTITASPALPTQAVDFLASLRTCTDGYCIHHARFTGAQLDTSYTFSVTATSAAGSSAPGVSPPITSPDIVVSTASGNATLDVTRAGQTAFSFLVNQVAQERPTGFSGFAQVWRPLGRVARWEDGPVGAIRRVIRVTSASGSFPGNATATAGLYADKYIGALLGDWGVGASQYCNVPGPYYRAIEGLNAFPFGPLPNASSSDGTTWTAITDEQCSSAASTVGSGGIVRVDAGPSQGDPAATGSFLASLELVYAGPAIPGQEGVPLPEPIWSVPADQPAEAQAPRAAPGWETGWRQDAVGAATGSLDASVPGQLTVQGSAFTDLAYDEADHFAFAYRPVCGTDVTVTARLKDWRPDVAGEPVHPTQYMATAGIFLRDSLATSAPQAGVRLQQRFGTAFVARTNVGDNLYVDGGYAWSDPYWFRLRRTGTGANTLVTVQYSADGITWAESYQELRPNLGATMLLGIGVSSHRLDRTASVTVDSWSVAVAGTEGCGPTFNLAAGIPQTELNWAPNTTTGGDPVNTVNGAYLYRRMDLAIAGRGPAPAFMRAYSSNDTRVGALGPGWRHSYAMGLYLAPDSSGDVYLVGPEGRSDRYRRRVGGTGYDAPPGIVTQLAAGPGAGVYTATLASQGTWTFDAVGRLTAIRDRFGNTAALAYDTQGRLVSVADPAGRGTLSFIYQGCAAGRLCAVSDWTGRQVWYGYDSQGRLQTVTDRENQTTTYGYEGTTARLTTITDANGRLALESRYGASGRVEEQWDARRARTGFAYAVGPGGSTTTIQHPAASFEPGWLPEEVHQYDVSSRLTSRTFRPTSSEIVRESYTYTPSGFGASVTDPAGSTTRLCYDADYQGQAVAGSRGNLTRVLSPPPATGANPLVTLVRYDARNNVTQTVPPKGVANGASVDCSTDLSSAINPAYVTDLAYDAAGANLLSLTQRFTDPELGLQTAVTKLEYGDPANPGQVTRVIPPAAPPAQASTTPTPPASRTSGPRRPARPGGSSKPPTRSGR